MNSINKKFYLTAFLVIFLNSGIIFSLYYFLIKEIKSESKKYTEIKTEISETENKTKNLIEQEKELKIAEEKLRVISNVLVRQEKIIDLIKIIENQAQKDRVAAEITKVETFKPSENGNTLDLQINITGDFNNNLIFLNNIKKLPYYSQIEKIQFKPVETRQLSDITSINISASSLNTVAQIRFFSE